MDEIDKGMIHALGEMKQNITRFYYAAQNSKQWKTYGLFIFQIFYLIFSGWG